MHSDIFANFCLLLSADYYILQVHIKYRFAAVTCFCLLVFYSTPNTMVLEPKRLGKTRGPSHGPTRENTLTASWVG